MPIFELPADEASKLKIGDEVKLRITGKVTSLRETTDEEVEVVIEALDVEMRRGRNIFTVMADEDEDPGDACPYMMGGE